MTFLLGGDLFLFLNSSYIETTKTKALLVCWVEKGKHLKVTQMWGKSWLTPCGLFRACSFINHCAYTDAFSSLPDFFKKILSDGYCLHGGWDFHYFLELFTWSFVRPAKLFGFAAAFPPPRKPYSHHWFWCRQPWSKDPERVSQDQPRE